MGCAVRRRPDEQTTMNDLAPRRTRKQLDSRLRDDAVLDEIELTSRLIIAASANNGPLSRHQVDEILGIVTGD